MRAFINLAGHILGSHPQINGYYEMHICYVVASALDRQLSRQPSLVSLWQACSSPCAASACM
jgi:hypothetical protein